MRSLSGDHDFLGEWLYHITVMDKPSAAGPWGWQLDGHHAIVNYFVLDYAGVQAADLGTTATRASKSTRCG